MQRVDQFAIFQTVGRDAGWLAASSALARSAPSDPPHIIYVPELPLTEEQVLTDVERSVKNHGFAYMVVGEGVLWTDERPVSDGSGTDGFSNVEFGAYGGGGAAISLHRLITSELGYRGEFQIPESMAMAADDRVVDRDRAEAREAGREAVRLAAGGVTGVMVALGAKPLELGTAPLSSVAINAKPMPSEMVRPADVTDVFLEYARDLIGPLPTYVDVVDDWQHDR
jgi:6-phosphofructokinase 1